MFAPTAVPPEIKADTAPEEPARPAERTAPRSPYASIDHVRALIDIQATDDIARLRTAVIRSIWKRDQLPARVADEVVLDVDEPSVEGLASVAAVDTIPCW
ncbi:hypothetical protein [Rhodospira trueperi]|nr:hypothetical protein [Rhodospira trueperi]